MPRNIVLCFDDILDTSWVRSRSTNVVRLYGALALNSESQVAYYSPSLVGAATWRQLLGLAFGYGVFEELRSAYNFLVQTYEQGDRLFFFGVGRGAYTARTLAGILHLFGLIRRGSEAVIPYAIRIATKLDNETFEAAREFAQTFSRECPVYFVGVWETPAQFGWIFNPFPPLRIPFSVNNPGIEVGRHAIAIDERRALFQPNLWQPLAPPRVGGPRNLKQVWFPGVHSDVCGGYTESESGLSKISLEWMLAEAVKFGLIVDHKRVSDVLGRNGSAIARPDPSAPAHASLRGLWWVWELLPIQHFDIKTERMRYDLHLGRRRLIPEGSLIHESALDRGDGSIYPKSYTVESDHLPSAAEGSTVLSD
jgi:uncharacterized protein (DUF2235 family)